MINDLTFIFVFQKLTNSDIKSAREKSISTIMKLYITL